MRQWVIGIGAVALGVCVALGAGLWLASRHSSALVQIGSTTVNARIVASEAARSKGLGGYKSLPHGQGMLFVFQTDGMWGIWMKDMHFAIDIIWLDNAQQIVDIARNVSPNTYPDSFKPKSPARYVLEVPAGTVQKAGIGIGQQATFTLP